MDCLHGAESRYVGLGCQLAVVKLLHTALIIVAQQQTGLHGRYDMSWHTCIWMMRCSMQPSGLSSSFFMTYL